MLIQIGNKLLYRYSREMLQIEPWGKNALRVRATMDMAFLAEDWALLAPESTDVQISLENDFGTIRNGAITASVDRGTLSFYNEKGQLLFAEQWRGGNQPLPQFNSLKLPARSYQPLVGGNYKLEYRLDAYDGEKIYGMGQYQDGLLDKKGAVLELAQRNSQASVPFFVSSRGYGFLWNNPAIGRATFATNRTEWIAEATNALDYWVTAEDKPEFILQNYVRATGLPPMMPDYAMGFWQCKLRYRTQDEVLAVAREYHRRGIQLDVLVIDFFHWTQQGEWKFDPRYFPDPDAMITELKSMGIETMVSIWPTVDFRSENYHEMLEKGFLVHCNRGVQTSMLLLGDQAFFDATDPNARVYVWQKILENYFKKGIKLFWLDVAEPEYTSYDFDHYRYALGQVERVGNMYPVLYAKAFYDGLREQGVTNVLNLIRCAWAGSQQYGTLVWSGDIGTDFETLRNQLAAGLSMAMAGIPWWTTDIGGFHGGDQNDPAYRELLLRWFQWGTFCPVMRLHGHRLNGPTDLPEGECGSGGPNEIWSYGEEAYEIMKTHIKIRNKLKPYLKVIMHSAHEKGDAVMSPLFLRFPEDQDAWEVNDEYMLGPDLLVAPVLTAGARKRNVYLPKGANWIDSRTGERFAGGHIIASDAPLQNIPTFYREGGMLK